MRIARNQLGLTVPVPGQVAPGGWTERCGAGGGARGGAVVAALRLSSLVCLKLGVEFGRPGCGSGPFPAKRPDDSPPGATRPIRRVGRSPWSSATRVSAGWSFGSWRWFGWRWCLARLSYLQLFCYSEYLAKAQHQQQRIFEISPMRGTIYDRKGRELAVSLPMDSVFADPAEINDVEMVARLLSRVAGRARRRYRNENSRSAARPCAWRKSFLPKPCSESRT